MLGLKPSEMLMILVIVLVLFGGTRLAGLGSALGQGIRNFKKGLNGEEEAKSAPGLQTATRIDAPANGSNVKQG